VKGKQTIEDLKGIRSQYEARLASKIQNIPPGGRQSRENPDQESNAISSSSLEYEGEHNLGATDPSRRKKKAKGGREEGKCEDNRFITGKKLCNDSNH